MKKLFLTGTSGFLGWKIFEKAHLKWDIFGSYFSNKVSHRDLMAQKLDFLNPGEMERQLETVRPDALIHTAAQANINHCEKNPKLSHVINVEASLRLAKYCKQHSIPYVFVSTDLVFDGKGRFYREADEANPICEYGRQKFKAEKAILKCYPEALIARAPLMFGEPGPEKNNGLRFLIESLQAKKNLRLFNDEFRTPMYGCELAGIILKLLGNNSGIWHVASRERISRYELGCLINQSFGLDGVIESVSQKSLELGAPRPSDVSLNTNKLESAGIQIKSLSRQIQDCCRRWKKGKYVSG